MLGVNEIKWLKSPGAELELGDKDKETDDDVVVAAVVVLVEGCGDNDED